MEIKDTKAFRAAQECASKDEVRIGICGVRIELDGAVVSTDGHILFKSGGAVDMEGQENAMTIQPAKFLPKNTKNAKIDLAAEVIITEKEHIRFKRIEEKFPDYETILPKDEDYGELPSIGVGTKAVIKVMTALDCLREKYEVSKCVTLTFGRTPANVIKITLSDRPATVALLMPARV